MKFRRVPFRPSTHVTPEYEAALVIPDGNTWTVDGTHEYGNVDGEHNVEFWLKARDAVW